MFLRREGPVRCTHEFAAAVAARTRSLSDPANQKAIAGGGGAHKTPHLAEKLLVVDGCWGMEGQFSLKMQSPDWLSLYS